METVADGSIDFNHVNFSYKHGSGEKTLSAILTCTSAPARPSALSAEPAAGKSSLVNLISRLYDVDERQRLRGRQWTCARYDMEALRNQVAVVLQKNVLFSGTILDNLRWGKDGRHGGGMRRGLPGLACADEFIERFPDGYNTWIEQGGSNVSGGQKQRLCIARALLKKPKVLILDDSTSAVDTATDAKIREAFAKKIPGTTKLIIAQRISSVQDADRILVLEDGKINGFDTHENLAENQSPSIGKSTKSQIQGGGDFDQPAPGEKDGVFA